MVLCVSVSSSSLELEERRDAALQLGRCEYKARTASAENILHETESQQEQSAPVGIECTTHRAMGKVSAKRLNLSLQYTQGIQSRGIPSNCRENKPLGMSRMLLQTRDALTSRQCLVRSLAQTPVNTSSRVSKASVSPASPQHTCAVTWNLLF